MPAFVQHASGTGHNVSSVTVALSSASTSGNILIANISTPNDTTVSSITLNGSADNWAQEVPNSTFGVYQWADPNCGAGTAIAVHFSGTEIPSVDVFEFSGLATSSPLDKSATNGSGGTGAAWSSGTTSSISQASEVLVAFGAGFNAADTTPTITPPGTWVSTTLLVPTTAVWQQSGYQVVGTISTYSYTGTSNMTGTNNEYGGLIGTYKASGSSSSTVSGSVSSLTFAAPAGTVSSSGAAISGTISALTLAAIRGEVSVSTSLPGTVSALTFAAPAGAVSVTVPTQVTATYYGLFTRGYLQYTDLESGHTLVARQGNTYTLTTASGQSDLTKPPSDGWWVVSGPSQYLGPLSSVPGRITPGALTPGAGSISQHSDMVVFRRDEALAPTEPPAHFTAADRRRWRQRQVVQAIWAGTR